MKRAVASALFGAFLSAGCAKTGTTLAAVEHTDLTPPEHVALDWSKIVLTPEETVDLNEMNASTADPFYFDSIEDSRIEDVFAWFLRGSFDFIRQLLDDDNEDSSKRSTTPRS